MEKERNKIRIERNDATTSHNGNILVEVESYDLKTEELKKLALEIVEEIKRKRSK
tara:strand:+ start:308 stop:472 length:165 start_codon:yes stop_codon:yes gene_type:complete